MQQQKRILIIDDDSDLTMTLQAVLEQNGFNTHPYTDPEKAYKNFREGLYDLVVLGIKMPVVDGFLQYKKIRRAEQRQDMLFNCYRICS